MTSLAPNRAMAAELIVAGELKKVVAEKVGVSAQTISEWQSQPAFQAYLNQLRWAALERARIQMQRLAEKATGTIENLLGQDNPPSARLRAAQLVLEIIGMKDPQSGLWGWGIGPTDECEIRQKPVLLKLRRSILDE